MKSESRIRWELTNLNLNIRPSLGLPDGTKDPKPMVPRHLRTARRAGGRAAPLQFESLESRQLLHGAGNIFAEVTLETNVGDITFKMRADKAPGTVDNFLDYVESGRLENSIFHRLVSNFVLQGGGFTSTTSKLCDVGCQLADINAAQFDEVETFDPIVNEFNLSNLRGTVAMAKLGGDPDSATSQFFVNLNDNSSNLNNQNGGFTVFAEVPDMTVVNRIAAFPQANLSSKFPANSPLSAISAAPIDTLTNPDEVHLVLIESVSGNAVLHGTFFQDRAGNGTLDTTDIGVFDIDLYIDSNDNGEFDTGEPTATTESDGAFHFIVAPGTYKVRVQDNPLNQFSPSNAAGTDGLSVTVRLGEDEFNMNYGFRFSGTNWVNPNIPFDINGDNIVSPIDANIAITELFDRNVSIASGEDLGELKARDDSSISVDDLFFYDVDNDMVVSPFDALLVINNLPGATSTPAAALSAGVSLAAPPRGNFLLGENNNSLDAPTTSTSRPIASSVPATSDTRLTLNARPTAAFIQSPADFQGAAATSRSTKLTSSVLARRGSVRVSPHPATSADAAHHATSQNSAKTVIAVDHALAEWSM